MTDEERRTAIAEIIENVDQHGLGDGSRALDVALDAITDLFAPQAARIAELEKNQRNAEAEGKQTDDELVRRLQHLGDWAAADRIQTQAARIAELEAALLKFLSAINRSDFSFEVALQKARALVKEKGNE